MEILGVKNRKVMVRKILVSTGSFLSLLVLVTACSIVELGNDEQIDGTDLSQVDLGSGDLPTESAVFGQMLHNNSSKIWRADEFTIEGLTGFLDCRQDDTITLSADGTYTYDGGTLLCGGDDNTRNKTGNWSFDFENKLLIIEPGTDNETSAKVVTLETGLITMTGIYTSDIFGIFDVAGSYKSE